MEKISLSTKYSRKGDGCFVEIGCLDGIEYSNTYFFEKIGWNGVCIEAHNDFIDDLRNRPNSTVVHCAVGEDNRKMSLFMRTKLAAFLRWIKMKRKDGRKTIQMISMDLKSKMCR